MTWTHIERFLVVVMTAGILWNGLVTTSMNYELAWINQRLANMRAEVVK